MNIIKKIGRYRVIDNVVYGKNNCPIKRWLTNWDAEEWARRRSGFESRERPLFTR